MKTKNTKFRIHGVIFDDFLVKGLKKSDFNNNKNSVLEKNINRNLGGVGNILHLNFKKNTLINLYSDTSKSNNSEIRHYKNFNRNPSAVIFENFNKTERLSIVSEGKIKKISDINIKANELFLGYYIECLPIRIKNNNGIVVFDFNSSPQIISNKIFLNNLKKTNFLLKSLGENRKIINKNLKNINTTLIEHDPKKVIVSFFKNKKLNKEIIINPFFKKKKTKSVGLGDLFAYLFCLNLQKERNLKKNIIKVFKKISKII